MNTKWIITIVNTKTFKCDFEVTEYPERISDIETMLEEDETMFVNELGKEE